MSKSEQIRALLRAHREGWITDREAQDELAIMAWASKCQKCEKPAQLEGSKLCGK